MSNVVDNEIFKGKRVLIVEDNTINAEVITSFLAMKEMEADVVHDGEQAVEKFEKEPNGYYDAVLMDITMPVMSGVEASTVIRNLHKQDAKSVPIICVTANDMFEDEFIARRYGMDDYIAKPIEPDKLFSILEKWFVKK